MNLRSKRQKTGFTLVEMIVATTLLAIGVVGTLGAIGSAAQTTIMAEGVQNAALLAQQQITQLQIQPDQLSGGGTQGDGGPAFPGYKWQESIEATDYTNLFKVTITVTWSTSPNDTHSREFITYLSNNQNTPTLNGSPIGTSSATTTQ